MFILDSINFVLGSKADKSMIRHGQSQAQVTAEFQVDGSSPAAKAVEELDIECDGQIIISRKFSLDGKWQRQHKAQRQRRDGCNA